MTLKNRLDVLLVEQGYFPAVQNAQGAIMAGLVYVDGKRVDKAGTRLAASVRLEVRGQSLPYVSRGGLKLAKAIDEFDLVMDGKVMIDIGASTGGFTDCALQNGAVKVYAVDVGYGQLAWSLRQDERVVVMEKTNARYLAKADFPELADIITIDVSFISLGTILPPIVDLLHDQGQVIALIKPQFEAAREQVGERGVVKDEDVHRQVIRHTWQIASELGLGLLGLTYSPITGPQGNIEFLAWFKKSAADVVTDSQVHDLVQLAHRILSK